MTFDALPENDCHAELRKNMIAELKAKNIHRPPLCISVAFDWYVTIYGSRQYRLLTSFAHDSQVLLFRLWSAKELYRNNRGRYQSGTFDDVRKCVPLQEV